MPVLKQQKSFVFSYESNFGFSAANVFICGSVQIFIKNFPKNEFRMNAVRFSQQKSVGILKKKVFFSLQFCFKIKPCLNNAKKL